MLNGTDYLQFAEGPASHSPGGKVSNVLLWLGMLSAPLAGGRATAIKSREAAPLFYSVLETTASFRVKTVNRYLLGVNSPQRFICEWSGKCAQCVSGVGMKLLGRRMGTEDAGKCDRLLPPYMWFLRGWIKAHLFPLWVP